jgi:hypothetical protein
MESADKEIDKIHNHPVKESVDEISYGTAQNEGKAECVVSSSHQQGDHKEYCSDGHHDEEIAPEVPERPEGSTRIADVHDVQERQDPDGIKRGQISDDELLRDLIKGDDGENNEYYVGSSFHFLSKITR